LRASIVISAHYYDVDYDASLFNGTATNATYALVSANAETRRQMNQAFFDFLVIGLVIFILRSTEILNYHRATGEVFMIVREMIYESQPVLLYMFVIATTCGIALSAGRPPPKPSAAQAATGQPRVTARYAAFAGLWAVLGDFEFIDPLYTESTASRNRFNWLPILLYVVGFMTTILIPSPLTSSHLVLPPLTSSHLLAPPRTSSHLLTYPLIPSHPIILGTSSAS
jgi:hypothetical protein